MQVTAGDLFEARIIGFPVGKPFGAVGVQILDNEGNVATARSGSAIEDPVGSGSYVTTLRAPLAAGDYTLYWDFTGSLPVQNGWEDLVVIGVSVTPTGAPAGETFGGAGVGITINRDGKAPHFDLPFRFGSNGHAATVEQDSEADIVNCVSAIVRTPLGSRDDIPTFGVEDLTFARIPVPTEQLNEQILLNEPRAFILIDESPSLIDSLVDNVLIQVSSSEEVTSV